MRPSVIQLHGRGKNAKFPFYDYYNILCPFPLLYIIHLLNLKFSIQLIGLFGRACADTVRFVIRLAFVGTQFYFSSYCSLFRHVSGRAHRPQRPAPWREEERRKTSGDDGGGGVPINVR